MALSGRFSLSLRMLAFLAATPETPRTSAAIAEALGTGPVMVRRVFASLHAAGLIAQRKGPNGGARLKRAPREIGLGEIYRAAEPDWLHVEDEGLEAVLKRARRDAVEAMNETTLADLVKRRRKG